MVDEKNVKLESISWGIFLIFLGIYVIAPDNYFPDGSFLLGVGAILLGLNYARYTKKIKINKFTTFVGLAAFLSGLSNMMGYDFDILPIILILWGLSLIFGLKKKKNIE